MPATTHGKTRLRPAHRSAPGTWIGLTLAVSCAAAACSASDYSRRAERSADRIQVEREQDVLGDRESTVLYPETRPDPEAAPGPETDPLAGEVHTLDLRQALALGYETNRTMQSQREELHLDALALAGTRHEFTPQLDLVIGYLYDEVPDLADTSSGVATFTASQVLPTGGVVSLNAASEGTATDGSPLYDSLVTLALAQPLLRGAGYTVTHEPLVQAERNVVYSIRNFELFREDFSIDTARRYYDLVNQKQSIENQQRNLENNEFGRRQAEALFAVGRANELDVLRARRSELTARNALLEAQEDFDLALENFRIFLGLSEGEDIDVIAEPPTFTPVDYDVASAVGVAMANRLDYLNRQEQLEDVARSLTIARNGLLPDLDFAVVSNFGTGFSGDLGGENFERNDTSVALTLGVPLDRVRERNAYRSAEIAYTRAKRDLEEFEDQLRVSIRSSFRELDRRLQSLEIQRQLIVDQTKNLRIAELRFERGELPNRDVVEANQSLLDAQNALIDEQVSYEVARLQLLRDLGILFVDDEGMWKR